MTRHFGIFRETDFQYFLKLKKVIFFSLIIFSSSLFAGVLLSKFAPDLSKTMLETLEELSQKTKDLNNPELLSVIFLNNAVKMFFVIVLGVLFGLAPWVFLLMNGYVVGLLALVTHQSIGPATFWLGVLPHGIFEVPALILGSSAGLFLGEAFYRKIFLKQGISLRKEFSEALIFFARIILPLLFIAAFIEVFVTQYLLIY